ncbi:Sugar transporter STL1 [Fusarium oxysporum f. sp. raphani]|uniref:Sugar transporter STL1 n=1 Tax=Fusarium oxysporum f. sp. raphani TaxID=96318 RepID=A0A8J5PWQ5_FUSOX|nr:Sugar transporter STL1 [Fusarium oxysporum f. sp. raphani]
MILIIIGAVLQACSFNLPELFAGRVITGLGTGLKSSTVPSYQSELCLPHLRGRLVSAQLLFVAVGVVFAYWFDYALHFVGGSFAWRFPLAFQIVFAAIVLVLLLDLPESPRWLYKAGRQRDATQALCRVFDQAEDSEFIRLEQESIANALELESRESSNSWLSLFKNDAVKTRRRVLLAYTVMILDQATGINLVVFYIPSALTINVGMDPSTAQIVAGWLVPPGYPLIFKSCLHGTRSVQIVFMLGSLLPTFALDRMGRRKTMLWGSFGLGFSMMMIAILLSFEGNPSTASAAVAFFFLNFIVVMVSPIIINRIGWKSYLIFMVIAFKFAFVPIIYFFYPETSNLSLEEIDHLFLDSSNSVGHVHDEKVTVSVEEGTYVRSASE